MAFKKGHTTNLGRHHLTIDINKEELENLYVRQKLSLMKCGKILHCSHRTILNRLRRFNIPSRSVSESQKGKIISKEHREKLRKAFQGEKNPMYGTHRSDGCKEKIRNALKGRHESKKTRLKKSKSHQGKNKGEENSNWKGGISSLTNKVRNSFKYRQWRSDIFYRDDFTCQKCDRRGGNLEAHHIESFTFILEINDIRTLEQARDCEELWNINNGETLCEQCHKLMKKERCKKGQNECFIKK